MRIDVSADPSIPGREPVARVVEVEVERTLDALDARLLKVEVELRDEPGGAKRCVITARPANRRPVAVSERAPSVRPAVAAALRKLAVLLERSATRPGTQPARAARRRPATSRAPRRPARKRGAGCTASSG